MSDMSRLPTATRVAGAAACALFVLGVLATVASTAPMNRVAALEAPLIGPARTPSPAAGIVAFSRGKEEKYSDIYVAEVDGSNVRRLTRGPGFKYDPDWSPDGRRLLYRYEPPVGTGGMSGGLVVMRADGGGAADIAKRMGVIAGPASWAPSGKWIAFSGGRKTERNMGIYVARPNGSGLKRLTPRKWEAQYPAWSPDGRKIAFTYVKEGGFNVYVMNADGSGVKQLTRGGFDNWPVWSPDSKQIAFNRVAGIWLMSAEGAGARALTEREGAPMNWAPSKWLIFGCERSGGGFAICAQLPSGRRATRLLGGAEGGFPAWRP